MIRGTIAAGKPADRGRLLTIVSSGDGAVQASAWITGKAGFTIPFLASGTYTLLVDGRPIRSFTLGSDQQEDLGSLIPAAP